MSFDQNIFLSDFQSRKEILYFGSAFVPNPSMKNHLFFSSTFLFVWFLILPSSFMPREKDNLIYLNENIKIRESVVDLQVSIGDKLFVFGKKSGTLDMVKVGMDLLPFSQLPQESNPDIKLRQIGWKRLKNGTVQIISLFDSWPTGLVWSIFPDGKLKMEATGEVLNTNFADQHLGLDFDFPEMELKKFFWKDHSGSWGEWSLESPNQNPPLFFASIDYVDLVFDQVGVKVRSDERGVGMQWKSGAEINQGADIRFILQTQDGELSTNSKSSDTPDSNTEKDLNKIKTNTSKSISLWFDFQ